jgi:hypothetical protein
MAEAQQVKVVRVWLRLVRGLAPHSEPGFLDHRASDAAPFR